MILDALIGFASAVVEMLVVMIELVAVLFELAVWAVATAVYFVAKFFGYSMEKPVRKPRERINRPGRFKLGVVVVGLIVVVVGGWYGFQWIFFRELKVQASDGLGVPFGIFDLESSGGAKEVKTDVRGKLKLPRFGWTNLHSRDWRYIETNWVASDLPEKLVLSTSSAAQAIDRAAVNFLKTMFETNKQAAGADKRSSSE